VDAHVGRGDALEATEGMHGHPGDDDVVHDAAGAKA
jgi:hypothetical protein